MTRQEIGHRRLYNQRISPQRGSPSEVVRWLGAVQAQDYLALLWAIGLRAPSSTEADIERAISNRSIVRTWPMRGTIHWVGAEDVWWMLQHLTPKVMAGQTRRHQQLELDQAVFTKSGKILEQALQGGNALTRGAIYSLLAEVGISTTAGRGMHILGYHAHQGLICFGPRQSKQPTFVWLEAWIPKPKIPSREEALAELAWRYFCSHGPATLQDFAWWSGLSIGEARKSLEAVKSELEEAVLDRHSYWFSPKAIAKPDPSTFLLPAFDEYLVGYANRDAVLDPAQVKRYNAGGGMLNPVVVVEGQVVGVWKRKLEGKPVRIELEPFQPLNKTQQHMISVAAEKYGMFLGRSVML